MSLTAAETDDPTSTTRAPRQGDLWFGVYGSSKPRKTRLFCLPYAGSLGHTFVSWQRKLPSTVGLVNVHLPGRSPRHSAPPFRRMDALVADLAAALQGWTDLPFVLFGHSLGALISYQLALELEQLGQPPKCVVVSGCRAPHATRDRKPLHMLADDQLLSEVLAFDGSLADVLADRELSAGLLPLLRADLELAETYGAPVGRSLRCPIVALGGADDSEVSGEELAAWSACTTGAFSQHVLPGGHLFIRSAEDQALQIIKRTVED